MGVSEPRSAIRLASLALAYDIRPWNARSMQIYASANPGCRSIKYKVGMAAHEPTGREVVECSVREFDG